MLNRLHSLVYLLVAWTAVTAFGVAAAQSEGDAFAQLRELSDKAPSRHVSQPGNAVLRDMIRERFDVIVKRHNSAEDLAKFADLHKQVLDAEKAIRQARYDLLYIRPEQTASEDQLEAAVVDAAKAAYATDLERAKLAKDMWLTGEIKYPLARFEPGEIFLVGPGGTRIRVHQMATNLVDPGNLLPEREDDELAINRWMREHDIGTESLEAAVEDDPAEVDPVRLEGRLVYVGRGEDKDLAGKDLVDAIAVIEFNSAKRWLKAVEFGARAVVVLEPEAGQDAAYFDASQMFTPTTLSVPRVYAKRDAFASALGSDWKQTVASFPKVTLEQTRPGKWASQEAQSHWLFIPAAGDPPTEEGAEDPTTQLVHLQVYYDANSVVPEMSPGATSLANVVSMLRLLDHFEANPPSRPVLVTAVNGHANGMLGEQEFAAAAFALPEAVFREADWHETYHLRNAFVAETYDAKADEAFIHLLRDGDADGDQERKVAGESIKFRRALTDQLKAQRNVIRTMIALLNARRDRLGGDDSPEAQRTRERYEAAVEKLLVPQADITNLMNLFALRQQTEYSELTETQIALLGKATHEIAVAASERARDTQAAHDRLVHNMQLRSMLKLVVDPAQADADLAEADTYAEVFNLRFPPLATHLSLSLDLSFGGDQMGVFAVGYQLAPGANDAPGKSAEKALDRVKRIASHALEVADGVATATNGRHTGRLANTILNYGGIPPEGYIGLQIAMPSRAPHQYNQPGLTLTTIHDNRPRTFTPYDTVDRINRRYFDQVMDFTDRFVPAIVNTPGLGNVLKTRVAKNDSAVVALGVRMRDAFSVTLPKTPLNQAIVTVWAAEFKAHESQMKGEVRPNPVWIADSTGEVFIRGAAWRSVTSHAYRYDESWSRMTATLDSGEGEKNYPSTLSLKANDHFIDLKVIAFECEKVDLVGLTEPLNLMPVGSMQIYEARSESAPRRFSGSGMTIGGKVLPGASDGTASVMLEPDTTFKLKVGRGLLLNASESNPLGEGFDPAVGLLANLVPQSAADMQVLSSYRLDTLRSKGVVNASARAFSDEAEAGIEASRDAMATGDLAGALARAEEARGFAYYAYQRSLATFNDLIKAAVIFLTLVIPFCFFFMKLVAPFDDITKQMTLFGVIFALMAVALWFLHPAFKIAKTPTIVILAFVMIGLAGWVASILVGRFNASMNQAIEEAQQSESTDASQSRLAGVAFMVGVNNMKRRRIRTTLTCATIVLVTFTMLSVISVSQDLEPARVRTGVNPPYPGFLLTRASLSPIGENQVERLQSHFRDHATVVARVWVTQQDSFGGNMDYTLMLEPTAEEGDVAPPDRATLSTKVIYGLDPAEDGLLAPMPINAGGEWFSSDDASEILLSEEGATLLGLDSTSWQGRTVRLLGHDLKIIGLLDDEALGRMYDLSDTPFLPLIQLPKQSQKAQEAASLSAAGALAAEAAGAGDLGGDDLLASGAARIARPNEVAFVPIEFARRLGGATYRTLSFKYPSTTEELTAAGVDFDDAADPRSVGSELAWNDANRLIQWQFLRLGIGATGPVRLGDTDKSLEPGQYALASSSGTQVSGVLKVAIPIILAATIIFNTMLGSVMERRREVSIYNAIGLNPGHVMMFFLAESFVFGLVGAVAGYLIGQALSLAVSAIDLFDLNLNYSSTSVLVVIFLTIVTVLLSTVYPAMMAARAAVPSGQRRWSLPQPEGDQIHVLFPFSYDERRVMGVCAYLRDYMYLHSEASTGSFLATLGPVGKVPQATDGTDADEGKPAKPHDHDEAYCMLFDIAPAPYDLGVNQHMEVYAYYDAHVRAHMLSVHLTRVSGEKGNWVTVNQPFLESLRKRLLGWRSQKAEIHNAFYEEGRKLFDDAATLPTRKSDSAGATA